MKRKTRQRLGFREGRANGVLGFVERVGVGVKNVRTFFIFIFWAFKVFVRLSWTNGGWHFWE